MVVICAAILSKSGKTLMSRQFVEINRPRIEGLLAAFPKLLASSANGKRQHTFMETPSVRYVYQPMEDLYMLIITNKSSNILEDLDALHLLAKIVGDHCGKISEQDVLTASFDLIFAFDECFAMGHKEKLTMRQIEENLEMDSHNERIHDIMQKNREREAEEQAAEVAQRLERERRAGIKPTGYSGGGGGGGGGYVEPHAKAPSPPPQDSWAKEDKPQGGGGGMKLSVGSKVNKDDAFLQQVAKQDTTVKASSAAAAAAAAAQAKGNAGAAGGAGAGKKAAVEFELTETVAATIDKEGEISGCTVKGELNICVQDQNAGGVRVRLPAPDAKFSFKTHPAVDKAAFKNNVLTPKDPVAQPFPVGRKVPVATWKSKGGDLEELTPVTLNCWPSPGADSTVVNMEMELQHKDRTVRNVCVRIPCTSSKAAPVVQRASVGDYRYDARSKQLEWNVALLDGNTTDGSLEFVIAALPNAADLFPIHVTFVADSTICAIEPLQLAGPNGEEVTFSKKSSMEGTIEVTD